MKRKATTITIRYEMLEVPDCDPDLSYLEQDYKDVSPEESAKYRAQDAARLDAYNRGDWACIGIQAKAHIAINHGTYSTLYTLKSPGLWGIESDSDPAYLRSVFEEQCAELRDDIEALKNSTITEAA